MVSRSRGVRFRSTLLLTCSLVAGVAAATPVVVLAASTFPLTTRQSGADCTPFITDDGACAFGAHLT